MNKVTLNGKPPKDRINLKEILFEEIVKDFHGNTEATSGAVYSNKTDNYYWCEFGGTPVICTLDKENPSGEIKRLKNLPSSGNITMFYRKNNIYIQINKAIYLYNVETNDFTQVESNLPDEFITSNTPFYNEENDELFVYKTNVIAKYSFTNKMATIISKSFPDEFIADESVPFLKNDKLYFFGTNTTTRKDITSFDIKKCEATNYIDALPYPVHKGHRGKSFTKVFDIDDKIHIFPLNTNQQTGDFIYRAENIDNWIKTSIINKTFISANTMLAKKNNDTVFFLNRYMEYSYEIKKAYVKE